VDEGALAASEGCRLVAEPDVGDDDRHVRGQRVDLVEGGGSGGESAFGPVADPCPGL
tara:strand:+ start:16 stop:186 length:171 start_codon:yes stop_codon:yes gene_type:complete